MVSGDSDVIDTIIPALWFETGRRMTAPLITSLAHIRNLATLPYDLSFSSWQTLLFHAARDLRYIYALCDRTLSCMPLARVED